MKLCLSSIPAVTEGILGGYILWNMETTMGGVAQAGGQGQHLVVTGVLPGDRAILPPVVGTVAHGEEGPTVGTGDIPPQRPAAQCKFFIIDFLNSYLYSLVCLSTSIPWLGQFSAGQGCISIKLLVN